MILFQGNTQHSQPISSPNPLPPKDPKLPSKKERLAYTIEWAVKIAYPGAFLVFNIAYWSYYMGDYSSEAEV